MAELDARLSVLESEMKLMKGEIKQSLVDLRSIVMKAETPLSENFVVRHGSAAAIEVQPSGSQPRNYDSPSQPNYPPQPNYPMQQPAPVAVAPPIQGYPVPSPVSVYGYPEVQPQAIQGQAIRSPAGVSDSASNSERRPPEKPSPWEPQARAPWKPSGEAPNGNGLERETIQLSEGNHQNQERPDRLVRQSQGQEVRRKRGHEESNGSRRAAHSASPQNPGKETKELTETEITMNVNEMSSLVKWVGIARHRMGENKLMEFLGLYVKYAHYPPQIKNMVTEISALLQGAQPEAADEVLERTHGDIADDCTDLMLQLHGILTEGQEFSQAYQPEGAHFQNEY